MRWRNHIIAGAGLVCLAAAWWLVGSGGPAPAVAACTMPAPAGPHPGMVWIPGGTFEMGDTVYPEEGPLRQAKVDGFWMDRHEVTNADFTAFVDATGYVTTAERNPESGAAVFFRPSGNADLSTITSWWRLVKGATWRTPAGPESSIEGRENYPVVALSRADILAYLSWKGRRLPTETEWEWAARGGRAGKPLHDQPKDANTWQGVFPVIDTGEDGFVGLAPAGCYQPNAYGLYDMIGNAWEWTADHYDNSPPAASVTKGGSFLCAANYCQRYRAAARQRQEDDLGTSHTGFRTVLDAPPPPQ